jgi:hypothetical protein
VKIVIVKVKKEKETRLKENLATCRAYASPEKE